MRKIHWLFAVFALPALSFGQTVGQAPQGPGPIGYLSRISPPSGVTNNGNPFRACASLDFDQDLRNDVVAQVGSKAWILLAPGLLDIWLSLSDQAGAPAVRDVASLGSAALLADAQGVLSCSLTEGAINKSRLLEGLDALELEVGDATEDGAPDLVVRTPGAVSIYKGLNDGSFECDSSFSIPAGAKAMRLVQWNGPAVAVLLSNQLYVYRPEGSLLVSRTGTGTATSLDAGTTRLDSNSLVVWTSKNGAGNESLHVERVGQAVEPAVNLANIGVRGIQLADLDFDGDSDLVASLSGSPHFLLMANLSECIQSSLTVNHFANHGAASLMLAVAGPTSFNDNQFAEPCLADFDNDSDVDLFLGVQAHQDCVLVANVQLDQDLLFFCDGGFGGDTLFLKVPGAGLLDSFTDLVVSVYYQDSEREFDPRPLISTVIAKRDWDLFVDESGTFLGIPALEIASASLAQPETRFQALVWFEQRDEAGNVVRRFPSSALDVPVMPTDGTVSGVTRRPVLGPFPPGQTPSGTGSGSSTGGPTSGG